MTPDKIKVMEAIRETAVLEIMPRFNSLSKGDIREKGPGDVVTTADIEAEKHLGSLLRALTPGSITVGEEETSDNQKLVEALSDRTPVWLIDPLDGTANFVRGEPCFATIVAYCVAGETIAGWIHDPIANLTAFASKGGGAWMTAGGNWSASRSLRIAANTAIAKMTGSLGGRARRNLARRREKGKEGDEPRDVIQYGCVGREYMDLAAGKLHFCFYARRLKPWDHAAGVLLHQEAGGFSAMIEDGAPYSPSANYANKALLLAPTHDAWEALKPIFEE